MTKTICTLTLTFAAITALAAPWQAAQAQHVSVRIDTPEFGIRIGTPHAPIYAPVYAPPVYEPRVYAPPVIVAPPHVLYPAPHHVYVPAPRIVVPAPIAYARHWHVPPGHAKHRAMHREHRKHDRFSGSDRY